MRSGASLPVPQPTVTDGGCYRVPVTARPKYAPKLILLSLADRCCSPGLSGCIVALRALLLGGSECKPSGAAVPADGHDTDPTSLDPPMAVAPGIWIAVPKVPFTSLSCGRRRGPFFCGRSSARPECRWLPPPPSPLQHHASRPGQPLQDKAIALSAAEADASAHCRNGCLCRRTDAIVGSLPAARLRRLQGYWREGVQDVFLWGLLRLRESAIQATRITGQAAGFVC